MMREGHGGPAGLISGWLKILRDSTEKTESKSRGKTSLSRPRDVLASTGVYNASKPNTAFGFVRI
jgi:hypothetical protein